MSGDSSTSDSSTFKDKRSSSMSESDTSLLLDHLNEFDPHTNTEDVDPYRDNFHELDIEDAQRPPEPYLGPDKKYKRWLWLIGIVCAAGWAIALALFVVNGSYKHRSQLEHNPDAITSAGSGKKITIDQLQTGFWYARGHNIEWIAGPNGEDGLILEQGGESGRDFLVVEDVRSRTTKESDSYKPITLIKNRQFEYGGTLVTIDPYGKSCWPSPDLKWVLVMINRQHNWRHSYTGIYFVFDVETQTAEPLDLANPNARIQMVQWSPKSDAILFVTENNMYMRTVREDSEKIRITEITTDGGEQMFNGVPDWVYEEEVFAGNSVSWFSPDGEYIAFVATNETRVPEYPVQYFVSRPSGQAPHQDEDAYPEVRQIKYPKAGAPNPIVHLKFYDVRQNKVFTVPIDDDFEDDDRLITEVIWAGETGQVLIRETNRESDILKMVLIDVRERVGKIARTEDVKALDGGWFEISETTTFVAKDPDNGRPDDGYIDTVIHKGFDHLGYFTPLNSTEPKLLTSGKWEVVDAPSAVDVKNNLVYFVGTRESSIQRHIYTTSLIGDSTETVKPLTDVSKEGYYKSSFSTSSGYSLLSYSGPSIPWQKVISTPSNSHYNYDEPFDYLIENNTELSQRASAHELPLKVFSTITIDGAVLNVVERRPPHFNAKRKYPVLFYLYGGPGSQTVDKKFGVDFQAYVASTLGYIVVTVDNRGTGQLGRDVRCIIRGNIGHYESHDQIATAKEWAKKPYVDPARIAIWGWSYGGYLTLKTLEQDAGETFKYGMAVAPVTDWRFYDSIYTERWMHTPQHNPAGYANASVSNVTALKQNERWLIMHGVADDNVHMQNTLTLLDKLDLEGVTNYDVHVFPDSDHSIYFHGANKIVYEKLAWWLTMAFNGEWAANRHIKPNGLLK